ncbi:sensor histidine kinase [Pedobacter boryungensis]|uniref:histidine kinase n=1 Tax=Pedobacter boryungensis TaxID=869962 RepID=A0ABX2D9C5_9SPHI|nr:PAS domain S-box protein [Pedobacter boryungensis]NQX30650.1 PAS domain S-box protein [Pedobacter boryungensis]
MIFEQLVKESPLAIYTCDASGRVTFFNAAAATLWGREPDLLKDYWCGSWKIFYPDGRPMELDSCPMALTLKNGKPFNGEEIVIQQPNGVLRSLLVYPSPVFDEKKILLGAYNTLVDITDKKSNDEKHEILSAIVESSDDAILSKGLDGIIKSWNAGAQKIFGYTEEEVLGKHITILIPPALISEEEVIISNIKAGKKIDHFHTVRLHKDGHEIEISLTVSPIKDAFGNITGASKVARDISELKKAERLAYQFAKRQTLLNSIGITISEKLDVKEILQKVTDATTEITGAAFGAFFYNTFDETGESFMLFTLSGAPREVFEKFGMPRNTAIFHSTFSGEGIVRLDDVTKDPRYGKNAPHYGMPAGHLAVVSYLAVPVISSSGDVIGGLFFGHPEAGIFKAEHEEILASVASQAAVALDNSKLFEEVMALSEKKDEFIALASHELKTPLTSLKGYLQMLQKEKGSKTSEFFVEKSLKQLDRLGSLVGDLLDVSKVEAGQLQFNFDFFDLHKTIEDILETFRYNTTSHIISFTGVEEQLMVYGDQQRIEQVIINLFNNAIKYSPHAQQVFVSLEVNKDQAIVIVKDNGIGLSKQQQKGIFKRFFRAEGVAHIAGLGLGLYISKEIIDRHQGSFIVKSEVGVGSEFGFTIPLKTNDIQTILTM